VIEEIFLRLLYGGVVGFIIGLTSIGGAVFMLPVLTLWLKFTPSEAVGTASLYSFVAKIFAGPRHIALNNVDFRVVKRFLIGAVPGNLVVTIAINRYMAIHQQNEQLIRAFQHQLRLLFIAVVFLAVILMTINLIRRFRRTQDELGTVQSGGGSLFASIVLSIAVGAVVGATAISAVIVVPVMILHFKLPARYAVGTSVFVTMVLMLLTSAVYLFGKQIDVYTALWMALGSFVGIYFGSRLTGRLPEQQLRIVVIVLVTLAAATMLIFGGK
jgi:hypothetical protein